MPTTMLISLSLCLSLSSSSFLCPRKFHSLCWGLVQVPITIKATTICFTSTTNLCHYGVQTCLGRMMSPNISFTRSISKLFWSQTSGMMPWKCGQAQVPSALMVPLSLSTQVCQFRFLFRSLFQFLL
jgi:hypothetical protein